MSVKARLILIPIISNLIFLILTICLNSYLENKLGQKNTEYNIITMYEETVK